MADVNILLLEADPSSAVLIATELGRSGLPHTLRVAAGWGQVAAQEPSPDVVIAGTRPAGEGAVDLLRRLRESLPQLPVVAVADAAGAALLTDSGFPYVVDRADLGGLVPAITQALTAPREPAPQDAQGTPPAAPSGDPLFKRVVEASADLIVVLDREGKRIYANPAYGGVLDDPEALVGTVSFDDVHPNDRDRIRQLFLETVQSGNGQRTDYRLMDGQGNTRVIESQGNVLRNADGEVERVMVLSRDVTAKRRSEESLQNLVAGTSSVTGEKFFVALVRHLARSLGVRYALVSECVNAMRDRVRAIAYWANERWVPSFEYDVRDTTCEGVIKEGRLFTFPDRVQELFPKMEALKAMNAVSYMGIPLFGGSEEPVGHLFIMDDKPLADHGRIKYILSLFAARASVELERMRSQKALKEAEIRFRTAVEATRDCVIVTDVHEIITYANPAMLELCGYVWKEIAGKLFFSLLLPEEDWQQSQIRTEQRMKGESEEYDIRLKRKDGTLVNARVHALPSYDDAHAVCGVIGLIRPLPA